MTRDMNAIETIESAMKRYKDFKESMRKFFFSTPVDSDSDPFSPSTLSLEPSAYIKNEIDYERDQKSCPSCIHGRREHIDFHWCTKSHEFESKCLSLNRKHWTDRFPEFLSEEDVEV